MNKGKKFLKWFLLTWILLILFGNALALTDADVNSWWKLDDIGNTADDAKNYNDGLISWFPTTQNEIGLFNTAKYFFNNTSDRIDLNTIIWRPENNFSINVWIKTSNSGGNRVFSNFNADTFTGDALADKKGWIMDCGGSNNTPRFGTGNGTTFTYATINDASKTCDTNNWRMLSATYDGNSLKIYVDGIFASDNNQSADIVYNTLSRMTIGAFFNGVFGYFQSFGGIIDEVSTYSKVLSDSDIIALWNSGTGTSYPLSFNAVDANFSYSIDKINTQLILINTSTTNGSVKIDFNTWKLGDTNIGYTQDLNYSAVELTDYNIGLRVDTNNGLSDTQYYKFNTGDWSPPVTTMDYNFPNNDNNALIQLYCTDNNSGCANTTYRINNGAWQNYTHPFNYVGTGTTQIDYNSTDNAGNVETTKTNDLNMPILVIVFFPKDQDTGLQIDHNWRLDISGASTQSYTDLNSDKNIFLPNSLASLLRVIDMDSNYRPATYVINTTTDQNIQPYLLLVDSTTNVLTKITTLKQTSLGLTTYPNVTIKIYKNIPGDGNSLIYQLLTDGKGQTSAYLTAGETYYFTLFDGNTQLIFNQQSTIPINVITTTITFTVSVSTGLPPNPASKGVFVYWEPFDNGIAFLPSGITWDINQYLINKSGQTFTATLHAYVDGNELLIAGTLPKTVTTNADAIFYNHIPWSQLTSGEIIFAMDINQLDGNTYTYYQTYTLISNDTNITVTSYSFDILNGLRYGLRQDLGYTANELCPPLLGLALLIIFGSLGILTIKIGSFGGQGTVGMALVGMSLFTYINWIPLELTAIAFILGGAFIINDSNLR